MYTKSFPRCEVTGSVEPVPYSHFISGAVPQKCRACPSLFEGGCTRAINEVGSYLNLDHGPCPVTGPTEPVFIDTQYYISKVQVPEKCVRCRYLYLDNISGFVCHFEKERWGQFPRSLDWGIWSPSHPIAGLDSGKSVSIDMLLAVKSGNEIVAIKAYKAVHKDATIKEAREAYAEIYHKIHSQ